MCIKKRRAIGRACNGYHRSFVCVVKKKLNPKIHGSAATACQEENVVRIRRTTTQTHHVPPELYKQRGVYSFRNGVYMAREDAFYAFGLGRPLSNDVVACKFVDNEFPVHHIESPWYDIPTPHLQGIMDYQKFPDDVCHWLYVILGRLLYPLNEMDGWQVIPFFKGMASFSKCFACGSMTLMYDGSQRAVENIGVGDVVMGDDGTPRRVLTLARGQDELFTLKPNRAGYPDLTVTPRCHYG